MDGLGVPPFMEPPHLKLHQSWEYGGCYKICIKRDHGRSTDLSPMVYERLPYKITKKKHEREKKTGEDGSFLGQTNTSIHDSSFYRRISAALGPCPLGQQRSDR